MLTDTDDGTGLTYLEQGAQRQNNTIISFLQEKPGMKTFGTLFSATNEIFVLSNGKNELYCNPLPERGGRTSRILWRDYLFDDQMIPRLSHRRDASSP